MLQEEVSQMRPCIQRHVGLGRDVEGGSAMYKGDAPCAVTTMFGTRPASDLEPGEMRRIPGRKRLQSQAIAHQQNPLVI
jgi:hypothetical protein